MTNNVREFSRVPDLQVVNWVEPVEMPARSSLTRHLERAPDVPPQPGDELPDP